jgi:hypothetical protein
VVQREENAARINFLGTAGPDTDDDLLAIPECPSNGLGVADNLIA